MTMTAPWYATREQVKAALDVAETSRANSRIDRLLDAASRSVEQLCHRRFYPTTATRYFDWPNDQMGRSYRLWLDRHELISVSSISSGAGVVTSYNLEPISSGPPYSRVELDLSAATSSFFGGARTFQRAIAISGDFGGHSTEIPAGALVGSVDDSAATVTCSDSSVVGTGDLIVVDDERLLVSGRRQTSTGATLSEPLAASKAQASFAVSDPSTLHVEETVLVDAERMMIDEIADTTVVVRRAQDGTILAAHLADAALYAPRALTVVRGALGSTAAAHVNGTDLIRVAPPSPVASLAIAETLYGLANESAGYARTIGSGSSARQVSGDSLALLRDEVYAQYGRKVRMRVV